jgi:hypothetical protein
MHHYCFSESYACVLIRDHVIFFSERASGSSSCMPDTAGIMRFFWFAEKFLLFGRQPGGILSVPGDPEDLARILPAGSPPR